MSEQLIHLSNIIDLGSIVAGIAVVGAGVAIFKFVFLRGRKAGIDEMCVNRIENKIDVVAEKLDNHLDEVPKLIKANDDAHAKLEEKVDKIDRRLIHIQTKIDPDYTPD